MNNTYYINSTETKHMIFIGNEQYYYEKNETKGWFKKEKDYFVMSREGAPAYISKHGVFSYKLNGEYHREDGASWLSFSKQGRFFIFGMKYSKYNYFLLML